MTALSSRAWQPWHIESNDHSRHAVQDAMECWNLVDLALALAPDDLRERLQAIIDQETAPTRAALDYLTRKEEAKRRPRPQPAAPPRPRMTWGERDREAARRMGWEKGKRFPCPFTRHEQDDRQPAAVLLNGGDRLTVYCHKCGESASATDAAEGIPA